MIGADQLVNGVWMGTVLLLLGLIPGLYQGMGEGVCRMADRICFRLELPRFAHAEFHPPRWFAIAGAVILAGTLLAYLLS